MANDSLGGPIEKSMGLGGMMQIPVVVRLPACLHIFTSAAFTLAFCTERGILVESGIVVCLLLPLLWLANLPSARLSDGLAERWWLLVLALMGWMAGVQALRPDALPAGWWRFAERGAALATCLFVMVRAADAQTMLRHLGAAATCALVITVAANGYAGMLAPMRTECFGFGHINILANTAGPSLLAWLVFTIMEWVRGRRPGARDAALLAVGFLALLIIAVLTARRGIFLGMAAAAGWFALRWLWSKSRAFTASVAVAGLIGAAVIGLHMMSDTTPSLRNERISLYRSGLEGIRESFPWGYGHYGALHLQTAHGEATRHMTACGGWGTHIHDEFLDVCLDGGPVALALVLALTAITGLRLLRIRDPSTKAAYQAMGVAIFAHLLTDNVYGTEFGQMWLGLAVGMIFAAPTSGMPLTTWKVLPQVRWLGWPMALIAAWGAVHNLYPAIVHKDATAEIHLRCLVSALDPQAIDVHVLSVLTASDPAVNEATQETALRTASSKMGWTGNTAILETRYALSVGLNERATTDMLRVLRFSPFYKDYYTLLTEHLERHPECGRLVPSDVQRRLAYLHGVKGLPRPDLSHVPNSIDEAVDLYAAIIWTTENSNSWKELSMPLERLCQGYGDIPGVTLLVLQAASMAPPGTFPWLAERADVLQVGLRFGGGIMPILAAIHSDQQAAAMLPVLEKLYPEFAHECAAGIMSLGPKAESSTIALRCSVVRLWFMARHWRESGAKIAP